MIHRWLGHALISFSRVAGAPRSARERSTHRGFSNIAAGADDAPAGDSARTTPPLQHAAGAASPRRNGFSWCGTADKRCGHRSIDAITSFGCIAITATVSSAAQLLCDDAADADTSLSSAIQHYRQYFADALDEASRLRCAATFHNAIVSVMYWLTLAILLLC